MRSRCTNKYFAVLISLALVSLALGSTRVKRGSGNVDKRVPDLSKKQDDSESQKKDETNSRSKRDVSADVETPEEVVVEDISDAGSDPIKKLGFDGALLRPKRQALARFKRQYGGSWRDHPYYNDSDSSGSSEETSESSDETSSESSDSETESSESESDSSEDSDDEKRRRRRRRRRNWGRWHRRW